MTEQLTAKFVYGDRNAAAGGYSDYAVGVDYDMGQGLTVSGTYSEASDKDETDADVIAARQGRWVVGLSQSF